MNHYILGFPGIFLPTSHQETRELSLETIVKRGDNDVCGCVWMCVCVNVYERERENVFEFVCVSVERWKVGGVGWQIAKVRSWIKGGGRSWDHHVSHRKDRIFMDLWRRLWRQSFSEWFRVNVWTANCRLNNTDASHLRDLSHGIHFFPPTLRFLTPSHIFGLHLHRELQMLTNQSVHWNAFFVCAGICPCDPENKM